MRSKILFFVLIVLFLFGTHYANNYNYIQGKELKIVDPTTPDPTTSAPTSRAHYKYGALYFLNDAPTDKPDPLPAFSIIAPTIFKGFRFYELNTDANEEAYGSDKERFELKLENTTEGNHILLVSANTAASNPNDKGFQYPDLYNKLNFGQWQTENPDFPVLFSYYDSATESNKAIETGIGRLVKSVITVEGSLKEIQRGEEMKEHGQNVISGSLGVPVFGRTDIAKNGYILFRYNESPDNKHSLQIETGIHISDHWQTFTNIIPLWRTESNSIVSRLGDPKNAKTFIIDHPTKKDHYLVHAMTEGPYNTVFYRGKVTIRNGEARVALPDYFEALTATDGRAVFVNAPYTFDEVYVQSQEGLQVKDGSFIIRTNSAEPTECHWEVIAKRKDVPDLLVEPKKSDVIVEGFGPYTYYKIKPDASK